MPFVIGEEPANWGDTITVTCTVLKGDHPIQIGWALNGEPISRDHSDISIVSTSKRVSLLTIDAVTARHAGEYTCTASNVAGGTSYSASLAVNGIKVFPRLVFRVAILTFPYRACAERFITPTISFNSFSHAKKCKTKIIYKIISSISSPFISAMLGSTIKNIICALNK